MRQWQVQDAKAKFSELLETCLIEGPQLVSRRGEPKAVLVPVEDWEALNRRTALSLKELLLGEGPRFDLELPDRGGQPLRDIPDFL